MRLFVAVEVGGDVATIAAAVRAATERQDPELARRGLKWVDAENLHVTLRFIGDVESTTGSDVIAAMQSPIQMAPFGLEFGGPMWLPGPSRPKVLMLPLAGHEAGALPSLKAAVDRRLPAAVAPEEPRPFRPHLTLARVRDDWQARARQASGVLAQFTTGVTGGTVSRAVLFESHLGPRGPRYVERASAMLAAS